MNSCKREKGQGLVENALILLLVALVIIVAFALMGQQLTVAYAKVLAGLNAQELTSTGTEYIILSFDVSVNDGPTVCTVSATNTRVLVLIDGKLAPSDVVAAVEATATGGTRGERASPTDDSGIATINLVPSSNAACSGTLQVSAGSSDRSRDY